MNVQLNSKLPSFYLRIAIGSAYLWPVADRFGILGANGQPHVDWGDWAHFMIYARQVMSFLPAGMVTVLAVGSTIGETLFGILILVGLFTRMAAIGSGILTLLGYSVFTVSAASFLLAALPHYPWSIDALRFKNHVQANSSYSNK